MADFIDKAQHKAEEIAGEAKENIGRATGSDELRRDGAGDKVKAGAHQAADTASDKAEEVADKAGDLADKASDKAGEVADKAGDLADKASGKAEEAVDKASDKVQDVAESVTDFADNAAAKVRGLDAESVAEAAQSPKVIAVAAVIVGAGVAAVLLSRRNSRRSKKDLPLIIAQSRRAARKLARDARK